MTVEQGTVFEDRLLLASLYTMLHVMDTDGSGAVEWYDDSMDVRTIIANLLADDEKRVERLTLLVCTFARIY